MSIKRKTVEALAPLAPPCFGTRAQWIEWLASAAEAQRWDEPGPLVITTGQPATFDYELNYCADCVYDQFERANLQQIGVCRPNYVRDQAPKTITVFRKDKAEV